MAQPLSPTQLVNALKKWKVPYSLYPGWETRTRPGTFAPIGFIIHHTGGPYTESDSYLKFLFVDGRSDVPAPLCSFAGGPSGTIHVGSLGRTNNAGMGSWSTRVLVGAESYPGYTDEIAPGPDDWAYANGYYYGLEICYPGTTPMYTAQYVSAVRLTAALMDAHGWTALSTIGHREHTRRKWDPGQLALDKFRRDVRDLLAAGPDGRVPGEVKAMDLPRLGDEGSWVEYFQRMVTWLGFDCRPFDGVYGDVTEAAITAFREQYGFGSANRITAWTAMRMHLDMVNKLAVPGPPGRAPTAEEIAAAVTDWMVANADSLKGEKGDTPTVEEVTVVVTAWLEANRDSLKGEPGPAPTQEQITQAVTEWLELNRASLKGEPGEPGRTPTKVAIELIGDVTETE